MKPAEKVAVNLDAINEQVTNMDQMIQKVLQSSEQDFLAAYSGHMMHVSKQLRDFKKKINSQKFENKKNTQVKNLQDEVEFF